MRCHIKGIDHICDDEYEGPSNEPNECALDYVPDDLIGFETQEENDKYGDDQTIQGSNASD
jgi:hypothetical protein